MNQEFERALEACASEPIHQIGHVQPHGGLLAFSTAPRHLVHHASKNIADFIGKDIPAALNQPLSNLFEPSEIADIETLLAGLSDQPTATGVLTKMLFGQRVELVLHAYRSGQLFVLEMTYQEAEQQETRLAELLLQTQQTMLRTDAYFETGRYFDLLVQLVRSLTGYDSVMVYRFDPYWNGEIIAQSRVEAAPSYLGMHFPASDIPAQARRLYTINLVRVVANVDAEPVPIVPALDRQSGQPLDLTYSALRSLSPIHIEYLRNIGVHASMVISLMQNDRLWGLIACHHLTSKPASLGLREAAIFISRLVSTRLSTLEAIEQRNLTDRANLLTGELLRRLPMDSVGAILQRLMPELRALLSASGMIVVIEGTPHRCGETPTVEQTQVLMDWLAAHPSTELTACDYLGKACSKLADAAGIMAGILATPTSGEVRNCIIWLRKEKPQTINWAGKYEEGFIQNDAGNFRLTPRKSFELWSEAWSGRCAPWTPVEVGVATMLALAIPESLAQKQLLEDAQRLQRETAEELRKHRDHLEELVRERTLSLSIAKEAAESANKAKTAFLSKISHELRTPMHGIMGLTTLALRRADEPKMQDYLSKVGDSTKQLLNIINDLIDISEMESERLSLNQGEFNLGAVISQVRRTVAPNAVAKNLALNIETDDDWSARYVLGDSARLTQAILALVENAIKFTATGSVTVRGQLLSDDATHALIRFEVQDTGIGISKEAHVRLFQAFEQVDNSASRQFGGAGLGLAICKRLIKMMEGDIGVSSTEGQGSTFWIEVRLPVPTSKIPGRS